jgi:hypothetical protein
LGLPFGLVSEESLADVLAWNNCHIHLAMLAERAMKIQVADVLYYSLDELSGTMAMPA